jgi:predicted CXXCH cytochrome family protein
MKPQFRMNKAAWIAFAKVFVLCLALGVAISLVQPATAAPAPVSPSQDEVPGNDYKTSSACAGCHADIHTTWSSTRHAQAFSSPIFQEDWAKQGSNVSCLECHTTGYDAESGKYAEEGVACESCHGPLQSGHPSDASMPITPDYTLCARCHKTTTDEWQASGHGNAKINCEACHNPHSQAPRADSITALCTNCHQDTGSSFTHGTHANSGLQCSSCHMSAVSHTDSTGGLFATGHTFSVGSEACVNCHKDTVHTRDTIVQLTGQTTGAAPSAEELEKTVHEQEQQIENLESQSSVRLYTGLIQGAIVGLTMGGVAAWIVSRRIQYVEVDDDDKKE